MRRLRGLLADTRPLKVPEYRRLFTAQIVTVIGAQLTVVTVPAQIYSMTGSSAYVGLTGLFGLVPPVIFGLYGGSLADHFDRRRLLTVTTWGLILTSAVFFARAALGNTNVWLLLSIFSVQQAFFGINQPTRSAVLPRIVPADMLPAANTLNMTVFTGGAIAGPLVGGALIPLLGFSRLYLVDTLFLFATLWAVISPSAAAGHGHRRLLSGAALGHRRLRLPRDPARAAHVLRRRPDRDGLRHAARTHPRDGRRRLRGPGRRGPGLRPALRRHAHRRVPRGA
uniref:MFS transporter n=1 Tax=Janibacter limosus TaxID=53458 RepID=A0AC61U334_9MICO|nr:MFS transporter [Janibacter limosus]